MNKDKIYLIIIVLLVITLIASCALQAKQTSTKLLITDIVIPKDGLKFVSEDGNMIAKITATKNGGVLSIFNNQEKPLMLIGAIKSIAVNTFLTEQLDGDGGRLIIYNNQEKMVALLGTGIDGGQLNIHNNQGVPIALMTANDDGGGLTIYDNLGNYTRMAASKSGGLLGIYDDRGNTIWSKP